MKRALFLIIGFLILPSLLGCATTRQQSELILNEEYFQVAHREIRNAKESIYLIAYLFIVYDYPDAYPDRILRDLINAQERGVDVRVILEYPKPKYMDEKGPKNQKVYERLKAAGIDVRFDAPETTTHNKVLIIDRETIITGSHNYSFSGLKYNNETSVLIRDKNQAERLIEYFEQID